MRRRRGIVRGSFSKKIGVLCLALLLGMGSLTVGYAMWSDTLTIEGTMETGEWVQCGTGYAYGDSYAKLFTDIIETAPWGWSNGPLLPDEDEYEFDIFVGAGGNDLNNGTLVGTLTVNYDGTTVTVTYDMDEGYTMDATHLYVGTDELPRNNGDYTTAPGQYPYQHVLEDATTDSYEELNGFSEEGIYVVAHADVCWFEILPP